LLYTEKIAIGIMEKFRQIVELWDQLLHITCVGEAVLVDTCNAMEKTVCMVKLSPLQKCPIILLLDRNCIKTSEFAVSLQPIIQC
jgi:hypothetical protein